MSKLLLVISLIVGVLTGARDALKRHSKFISRFTKMEFPRFKNIIEDLLQKLQKVFEDGKIFVDLPPTEERLKEVYKIGYKIGEKLIEEEIFGTPYSQEG